jgi:hypothetical protein
MDKLQKRYVIVQPLDQVRYALEVLQAFPCTVRLARQSGTCLVLVGRTIDSEVVCVLLELRGWFTLLRIQRGKPNTTFKDLPFNNSDIEGDNQVAVVTEEPGTTGMPAREREVLLSSGIAHEVADVQKVLLSLFA